MALSTSSISISAVKTALGTTESSVIALCRSSRINRFSAAKPFRSSALSYTYAELVAARKAANFGLNVVGYSTAAAALNAAQSGNTALWPHLAPGGSASNPCRLGDFRGYNHNAPVPYSGQVTANPGVTGSANASFEFDIDRADGAEVLVSQMGALSAGRWAVIYRKSSGTTYVAQGDLAVSTQFPKSIAVQDIAEAGTYEACAVILASGMYYPVPNTYKRFTIEFVAPRITPTWDVARWNDSKTAVSFVLGVVNSGASAEIIGEVTITLREVMAGGSPASGNQPPGSSPARFISQIISAPAGQTTTIKTGTFTGITYDPSKDYYLLSSGSYINSYTAIEEADPGEI